MLNPKYRASFILVVYSRSPSRESEWLDTPANNMQVLFSLLPTKHIGNILKSYQCDEWKKKKGLLCGAKCSYFLRDEVKHIFLCLRIICISSFVYLLFICFTHFPFGLIVLGYWFQGLSYTWTKSFFHLEFCMVLFFPQVEFFFILLW